MTTENATRADQSHELQSAQQRKEIKEMLAHLSKASQCAEAEADYIAARTLHDAAVNAWLNHCARRDYSREGLQLELSLERCARDLEAIKYNAFTRWMELENSEQLFEAWR